MIALPFIVELTLLFQSQNCVEKLKSVIRKQLEQLIIEC